MSLHNSPGSLLNGATRHSVTQSIATGVTTAALFDTDDYQVGGVHNISVNNSRFTNVSGVAKKFRFTAAITFGTSAVGNRFIFFARNGLVGLANERFGQMNFLGTGGITDNRIIAAQMELQPGDFIECMVFQSSGGPLLIGFASLAFNNRCEFNEVAI